MENWIDKLGDEVKSDWGKAKTSVQTIRQHFVDKIALLKPKLGVSAGVDIDAAIRVILDDSFLKVIDRITFALDQAIDKVGTEFQLLVKQVFSELSKLADRIDQTINNIFKNVSSALADIKKNLVDPIVTAISELEKKLIEDINKILDKIFDFFQGTVQDFKDDISRGTSLLIPNLFDECRKKTGTTTTPGFRLTSADVFNLFECNQLKRLEDSSVTVKRIIEVYAGLQLQSFRVTCLGRGSPAFQDIYTKKWIKYGQLYDLWKEFDEHMTAQQALDEAIRRLDQARSEYQAKANQFDIALQGKRVASGMTIPGITAWQQYIQTSGTPDPNGIFVNVDTRVHAFTSTPVYIVNLHGSSSHWVTTGGSSPYNATKDGFAIYVKFPSAIDPSKANS